VKRKKRRAKRAVGRIRTQLALKGMLFPELLLTPPSFSHSIHRRFSDLDSVPLPLSDSSEPVHLLLPASHSPRCPAPDRWFSPLRINVSLVSFFPRQALQGSRLIVPPSRSRPLQRPGLLPCQRRLKLRSRQRPPPSPYPRPRGVLVPSPGPGGARGAGGGGGG
jgi:hypothetical protein